jgi:hypothetical protein
LSGHAINVFYKILVLHYNLLPEHPKCACYTGWNCSIQMYSFTFALLISANSLYVPQRLRQKITIKCPLKFSISSIVGISPIILLSQINF